MRSVSTQNGAFPPTSPSVGCTMTSTGAATDLPCAPSRHWISRPRPAATVRPGSTGNLFHATAYHFPTPASAERQGTRWIAENRHWWTWAMPLACPDGEIRAPADLLSRLERAEMARVGRAVAAERGLTFQQAKTGEYVSGKLIAAGARQTDRPAHHRDNARWRRHRVEPRTET